jgi:glycosyltransferase involved in cell wall biosynthesis
MASTLPIKIGWFMIQSSAENKTMIPFVSVVMAVNRLDMFLTDAINSILDQSIVNLEFIIIANNCSDDLWNFLQTFKDSRLRLFRLPMGGLANALNFGICQSKSKYIARMDADDISFPSRLKSQFDFLENNKAVVLVGCDSNLIDENGGLLQQKFKFFHSDFQIRRVLPMRNPILHPAIMIRTEIMLAMGGYKYGHMSEDHELFIRIARNKDYQFHNINEVLFNYRRHPNQITDISRARKNFCEIAGFLFTEFLLTFNIKYIIGMCLVSPIARKTLSFARKSAYRSKSF